MSRAPRPPLVYPDEKEHRRQIVDYITSIGEGELSGWSRQSLGVSALFADPGGTPARWAAGPPPGWLFDGVATDEELYLSFASPFAWVPSIEDRVYLDVTWAKTTNAAGSVRWSADAQFGTPNVVVPAAATLASHTPESYTTDTNTADLILVTRIGPWTAPVGRSLISLIKLTRLQGHANDTYGADVILLGVDFLSRGQGSMGAIS